MGPISNPYRGGVVAIAACGSVLRSMAALLDAQETQQRHLKGRPPGPTTAWPEYCYNERSGMKEDCLLHYSFSCAGAQARQPPRRDISLHTSVRGGGVWRRIAPLRHTWDGRRGRGATTMKREQERWAPCLARHASIRWRRDAIAASAAPGEQRFPSRKAIKTASEARASSPPQAMSSRSSNFISSPAG